MEHRPWTIRSDGLAIAVRLTARARRDEIAGVELRADGRTMLKARVRAAATQGRAHIALERLIAAGLGVAPSAVTVSQGARSRCKSLTVAGDGAVLAAALERLLVATHEPVMPDEVGQ